MRYMQGCAFGVLLAWHVASAQEIPLDGPPFSATPEQLLGAATAIESHAPVLVLLDEKEFVFDESGAGVETRHLVYRIDTADGVENWSDTGVEFEPWHQSRPEIRARVITPDGQEHELDLKTLSEDPVGSDDANVYDNRREFHGPLPAVRIGAVVEEEIVRRDTKPLFTAGVVYRVRIGRNVPSRRSRLVVDVPSSMPFRYHVRLLPPVASKEEGGRVRLVVESGPLDAQPKIEPNLPGDVPEFPQVEFSTGSSWHSVAEEYARATEPRIRTADVEKIVRDSRKPEPTRSEAIEKLVGLLHKEVRYTGVEFDEASIIPNYAAETLHRKYGDCKDKASLLVAMLRATGIPANLALLSTGPGRDVAPDLPGLGNFDHAIVYVPGPPELWIDATADTTRVGDLPYEDHGRLALIVRDSTNELVRTPEASPTDNLVTETREFFLSEYGPARVVETTEAHGSSESSYRETYTSPDEKETRKNLDNYVKDVYLAEGLTKQAHDNATDFSRPFQLRLEVARAKRGMTDLILAVAAIRPGGIIDRLPNYLKKDDEKGEKESGDAEPAERTKPRTEDFLFDPFVTEWRYRITPPPGFRLHGLPENKTTAMGPANLTAEYGSDPDGAATAILRFNAAKGRYSPDEVRGLRKAVQKLQKSDPILIGFDQTAHALITSGKTAEGLRAYEEMAALHPKEALHRVQVARALLDAGLGEKARSEAISATKLEPKSALAYQTLGWILQHDLVGRRFKKGFDLAGAISAYRKAKELEPENEDTRADLAILLEEDANGVRYSSKADLDGAIAEYRELKTIQKGAPKLEDNVLFALLHARRFAELGKTASELPPSATREALQLAATAATTGAAAAIEEASRLTSNEAARNKALVDAGNNLVRIRLYKEASALLSAGAQGQTNSAALSQWIDLIGKTKRYDEQEIARDDPRSAVQRFFVLALCNDGVDDGIPHLFSKLMLQDDPDRDKTFRVVKSSMRGTRVPFEKLGFLPEVSADLVVSGLTYSVDGDEATGYRVSHRAGRSKTDTAYVFREDGEYRILGFNNKLAVASRLILGFLDHGNLSSAHRWLDWIREEQHLQGDDDPLAGPVFPRFWTKGQDGDLETMRRSAAALMVTTSFAEDAVPILVAGRTQSATDADRLKFDLALAVGYRKLKDWNALAEVAQRLVSANPGSATAFEYLVAANRGLTRWDVWEQVARERLQRLPDDLPTIRSLALRAFSLGRFEESHELLKPYVQDGKANSTDLNGYAWESLFIGTIDADALDAAQRANTMTQSNDFGILHTLASLYAETGKTREAHDLLLQAMDAGGMDEPDGAVWYGFGRIAEQYGENDAAIAAYARVEIPAKDEPTFGTTYSLAQKRQKGLSSAGDRTDHKQ